MTKTPFGVYNLGELVTIKSRKDSAIKFAIAQECDYVTNPAGQTVWTNPAFDTTEKVEAAEADWEAFEASRDRVRGDLDQSSVDAEAQAQFEAEQHATEEAITEAIAEGEAVAEAEEVVQDSSMTTTVEEAKPVKTRNRATRATVQPQNASSGRFLLATYDKAAGETGYAKRPDAILRAMLGIKWRELWALGFTQKSATAVLEGIAKGDIDEEEFIESTLVELDRLNAEADEAAAESA